MSTIKISETIELFFTEKDTTVIYGEFGEVALDSPEALTLASAMYAKYAEWKPICLCTYNEYVWLRSGDNIFLGVYHGHGKFFACDGSVSSPTHFTEIINPI